MNLDSEKRLYVHAKSRQSCLTLCDPMDCSLSDSSVHGIFQARVLEWGAIAFSDYKANSTQYSLVLVEIQIYESM